MPEQKERKIIPSQGGIFSDLAIRLKLIVRLLADRRVSPLLKLLPIGSLVYLVFPDLGPGPVDDVAVIWLGAYLFVELCPPEVVEEHMRALTQTLPGTWSEPASSETTPPEEVVEADFWEAEAPPESKGDS